MVRKRSREGVASVRRRRRVAGLVLVLGLASGPGCRTGGTATEQPTTTANPGAASPFCDAARAFVDQLGLLVHPGTLGDPNETAGLYRELAAFLSTAAPALPPEIQGDAAVAASVVTEYYQALEDAGLIEDRIPSATAAKLRSPQFVAAVAQIADYSRTSCRPDG